METILKKELIERGLLLIDLLALTKCVESKGQGRRIIVQSSVFVNGIKETDIGRELDINDMINNSISIQIGTKVIRVVFE